MISRRRKGKRHSFEKQREKGQIEEEEGEDIEEGEEDARPDISL